MRSSMTFLLRAFWTVTLLPLAGMAATPSDDSAPVQAVWKPVEIRYSYVAFTTEYNCDAFETKMRNILLSLGAPPQTQVHARGCPELNRPSKNFFVEITTAAAVPASEAPAEPSTAQDELLKRLGVRKPLSRDPFPAAWKTVDLSQNPRLALKPGDCELMQGLRDDVLPKLSIKVVSQRVNCTPHQLPLQTPELKVSALMPLPSPDKPQAGVTD